MSPLGRIWSPGGGGVIETKKAGSTLTGVEFQTRKYRTAYHDELPSFEVGGALPFGLRGDRY